MKNILLLFALISMILLTTGCYEVNVRIKVFENGEGMLTHSVGIPTAAMNLTMPGQSGSPIDIQTVLQDMARQDAASVSGLRLAEVSQKQAGSTTRLDRVFLFRDGEALAGYLSLLGLRVEMQRQKTFWCKQTKGFTFSMSALNLDVEKLTRLGTFYKKMDAPAGASAPDVSGQSKLQVFVELPGDKQAIEPDTLREGGAYVWSVAQENFTQPLAWNIKTVLPKHKALPLSAPMEFPLGLMLQGGGGDRTKRAMELIQRLEGRSYPVLHVRIDKKMQVDLAMLWEADELTAAYADYMRNLDRLLLPDLEANYYDWAELVSISGQERLLEGYRLRQAIAAEQLTGVLKVVKNDAGQTVVFTAPKTTGELLGNPESTAAMLLVTFPDGVTEQLKVTAGQMQGGQTLTLNHRAPH